MSKTETMTVTVDPCKVTQLSVVKKLEKVDYEVGTGALTTEDYEF